MNCIIINGHTDKDSLAAANAQALKEAAEAQGLKAKIVHAIDYPLVKKNPAKGGCPAEFDALAKEIAAADYLAVTVPMWNLGVPGVCKNFIDGVMQARVAFRYHAPKWHHKLLGLPNIEGLLQAKKVVIVWTAGGPAWVYSFIGNPLTKHFKAMFKFYGAKKVVDISLGNLHGSDEAQRQKTEPFLARLKNYKF